MKICLTINSSPWSAFKGGGQLAVHHLACSLFSKGHQVHVLYSKYPHEQFNIEVPYEIHWVHHYDFATINLNIFSFSNVLGPLAEKENFNVTSNSYFDIETDIDIGKVDQNYLYEVLSKIDLKDADALFVSCTALPVLSIIDKLEKKLNKPVLSSNQALIWDTLENIGKNNSIKGFGKLFLTN